MTEPVGPGALSLAAVTFEVQVRALRAGRAPMPHRAGHVEAVRALVLDPLTRPQVRQLTDIGRRIMRVVNPDDRHLDPSR